MARSKKRASMREGPLAALFASTEMAVADEDIRVTSLNGSGSLTAAEAASGHADGPVAPATELAGQASSVAVKDAVPGAPAEQSTSDEPIGEVSAAAPAAPAPAETLPPEPATGELQAYRVDEERPPAPVHEGLEQLMGGPATPLATPDRPIFGRDEPNFNQTPVVPRTHEAVLRVVGVGGAGVNAVNRMVEAGISGVEFIAVNTDLQSLQSSNADATLHIGSELTRGLGSGSDPRVGYRSAFDDQDKLKALLKGSDMVFVAAGAGGGTGTGAAPVVARLARDVGALTVGIVTKPFGFEGARRATQAEEGVAALGAEVDTLIVVPNERLLQVLDRRTSISDAFAVADDVLRQAVQGISDLVTLPGLINLDFADVRTTMLEAGDAILGIGMGVGEHRALLAAQKAVASPILNTSVEGAQSLLLSITGGPDLSLVEASEAARVVQEAAHPDAEIIFGASVDEDLAEQVWVTVIATRFETSLAHRRHRDRASVTRDARRGDSQERQPRNISPGKDDDWFASRLPSDRPPTQAGQGTGMRADVPEFIPGH